ncbi:N-acetyltransferase [Pseudomonas putida]|uniref:N-acetyltransferase n=1 Tax=Pseudomonas putida TaxID=303 RepID=A0A9X8EJX9_PSEPU|nr:N-acetyltransferase [Pseudomonas putida]ROQ53323.1 hypothetical protein EDF85_1080 [Pseudomonas putida]
MIDWLSNHPHHSDTLARWLHEQFAYEYADVPLAQWQQEFADGQTDGSLYSLLALDDGNLLGSASLARDDLPLGHTHLYLHTHDRAEYYHKRGWQYLEQFQAWGKSHWLMQYPL